MGNLPDIADWDSDQNRPRSEKVCLGVSDCPSGSRARKPKILTTTQTVTETTSTRSRMPSHRVLSYSLGDVANNLSFQMTSMFLMVYMTDIAGLSAGVAGTIYAVTKIWAGFTDLFAGQTVDRANTRWGRLRPWILFGSTPLAVVFVLLFSAPAGLSGTATVAWIFLFDAAFQLAYSFVNIPYGSLAAAMTQDSVDRSRLSGARSIASAGTGVALSAVIAPQFQDTTGDDVRLKFTITCALLGVLAVILYLICFANTREVVPRSTAKTSIRSTLKMVRGNKPLIVLCAGAFFLLAAMFTMNAVAMYYARYVLGNSAWFTFLALAQTVGTIIVASLAPAITVKLGKKNGYTVSALVAIAGFVLIYFVPAGSLPTAIVAWFLFGVGNGGTNALMFSMQADTVDYGEWASGTRSEGGSYSILSFIRKTGQGVGGWMGAAVIGAFGYVAQAPAERSGPAGYPAGHWSGACGAGGPGGCRHVALPADDGPAQEDRGRTERAPDPGRDQRQPWRGCRGHQGRAGRRRPNHAAAFSRAWHTASDHPVRTGRRWRHRDRTQTC